MHLRQVIFHISSHTSAASYVAPANEGSLDLTNVYPQTPEAAVTAFHPFVTCHKQYKEQNSVAVHSCL